MTPSTSAVGPLLGQSLVPFSRALRELPLEIGYNLLRIGQRAVRRRAHLRTSRDSQAARSYSGRHSPSRRSRQSSRSRSRMAAQEEVRGQQYPSEGPKSGA